MPEIASSTATAMLSKITMSSHSTTMKSTEMTTTTTGPRLKTTKQRMLPTGPKKTMEMTRTGMAETKMEMTTAMMMATSWTLPGKPVNSLETPTGPESSMPSNAQMTINAKPSKKLSNSHTATSMVSMEMMMKNTATMVTMATMATMVTMALMVTMAQTSEHDTSKLPKNPNDWSDPLCPTNLVL